MGGGSQVLLVGADNFPFPIPLKEKYLRFIANYQTATVVYIKKQ